MKKRGFEAYRDLASGCFLPSVIDQLVMCLSGLRAVLLKSFANKCQVEAGLAYFGAKRQSDGAGRQALVLS